MKNTVPKTLAFYNKTQVREILRLHTPTQLLEALRAGHYSSTLSAEQTEELQTLLQAWIQRALGIVTLRDALLVDPQRGERVYNLICVALTEIHLRLPPEVDERLYALDAVEISIPQAMHAIKQCYNKIDVAEERKARLYAECMHIQACIYKAETHDLALAYYEGTAPHYPFPSDLETLLPPKPVPRGRIA